jgi:hypothetical protein
MRRSAEACPRGRLRYERLFKVVLAVASLDSVTYGLWAVCWPDDLFNRLDLAARDPVKWKLLGVALETADHILLWRVLGVLFLSQALILAIAAWKPSAYGALVLSALIGRALSLGMWLWLLGTERVQLRAAPLYGLAVHDGVWALMFTVFLTMWTFRKPAV